jgi:hypothetical protein
LLIVRALNSSYSYSAEAVLVLEWGVTTEPIFDRQKLDVYRLSIEQVAAPCGNAQRMVLMPSRSIQRTDRVGDGPSGDPPECSFGHP